MSKQNEKCQCEIGNPDGSKLEIVCFEDFYVDEMLMCKKGNIYLAIEESEEDQKGYYTIMGCEAGWKVECTILDIGSYFRVLNVPNYI